MVTFSSCRWVQTGTLHASSHISSLSWNLEGSRLLTGGVSLQLWHEKVVRQPEEEQPVLFEIGGDLKTPPPGGVDEAENEVGWECIWKCHTATPVHHMAFSPDGTLFATSGKSDRLVKVWFENKHLLFPTKSFDAASLHHQQSVLPQELNYGFVYVAHPRAVTHISWRKTSKYMPKGSVSNMLVTSCLDNICRIWVETVLPDDGLVNMSQFDPLASQNPKFRTHRHKHRFMQRLKHMKTCFHIRRHAKHHGGAFGGLNGIGAAYGGPGAGTSLGHAPIPSLPSTYSVHDFHSYGYHGTGVTPGLHFHLAASINAETDIPLVPSMQTNDPATQPNFILHWLNNKEMHFSLQAEAILQEMTRKVIEKEDMLNLSNANNSEGHSEAPDYQHHHSQHQHDGDHGQQAAADNNGTMDKRKQLGKHLKSFSHDENSNSDEHQPASLRSSGGMGGGGVPTISNTTSLNSLATDPAQAGVGPQVTDSLDMKIECLLRDWHHNPDLLFAIHPIDGSYLIWVVEWLDEYHPGSFRQAQVSFSTRIPAAFPLGDAMSMSTTVSLYNSGNSCLLHFRDMVKSVKSMTGPASMNGEAKGAAADDKDGAISSNLPSVIEEQEADQKSGQDENGGGDDEENRDQGDDKTRCEDSGHEGNTDTQSSDIVAPPPAPTVSMVTKHSNGTLNLWQLTFADKTKFTSVLSIGHASRASGHRFRVNDITCHPVLPLLLTTSHHNIPDMPSASAAMPGSKFGMNRPGQGKDVCVPSGFCSELILWRVDAVGPLSQSGGVSELARINSPEMSAFSNVAWIPTLLPSTTLGNWSNSPSACFVASDGECLRVYQAVIDARTLLAEVSASERRDHRRRQDSMISMSTDCSSDNGMTVHGLCDKIKIVSQQSTARPGCVIQLDAIADATHDWQNTQFLHVFQEQLITGERNLERVLAAGLRGADVVEGQPIGLMETEMGAMVDLQRNAVFEEPFYIVILERTTNGSTLHMWRLLIASQPPNNESMTESMMYVPDSNLVQDLDEPELAGPRPSIGGGLNANKDEHKMPPGRPHVSISTTKVCIIRLFIGSLCTD